MAEARRSIRKKNAILSSPEWEAPPIKAPGGMCDDYYADWTLCYAMGVMNMTEKDLDFFPTQALVSSVTAPQP